MIKQSSSCDDTHVVCKYSARRKGERGSHHDCTIQRPIQYFNTLPLHGRREMFLYLFISLLRLCRWCEQCLYKFDMGSGKSELGDN